MDVTPILNKLLAEQDLTENESRLFLTSVMKGGISAAQVAAILVALRMKGETADEIVGLIRAMREQMIRVDVKDVIDVCGTGGDGSNSINVSTAVSLVVAACGVKVAKHGNRAASSKSGAADVLEALGVNINLTTEQSKTVLEKVGMVFLFAPNFHPATKNVVMVRKELKTRTVFNFLGPFLNPASTKRQLIGVPSIDAAKKLILVGKKLGYDQLVIVTSDDGMDEVSLSANTHVFMLKNNNTKGFVIDPKEYGLQIVSRDEIVGGTAKENAEFLKKILHGEKGARRDIVVLNSAVALVLAEKVSDIPDGIRLAEQAIDSGTAKKVLENLIKETNKYKAPKLHNILLEIVKRRREDLSSRYPGVATTTIKSPKEEPIASSGTIQNPSLLQNDKDSFKKSILGTNEVAIIAEVKFASPTNPHLGSQKELVSRVKEYENAGADAISFITEPHFFKGDISFISKIKKSVNIPILQKDFVIDERQIYQAKEIGSDALLLIARLVDGETLQKFVLLSQKLQIEPVVEINDEEDLGKAAATKTKVIAVNARDLETFEINVEKACKLMKKIPDKFIKLGFSGINSRDEVEMYKSAGVKGVLIGTSLMKAKNISKFLKGLRVTDVEGFPIARTPRSAGARREGTSDRTRKEKNVKVKICGVRTLESAEAAIAAGADFLGFNFVPTSKRKIDLKDAEKIIRKLRTKNLKLTIKFVGVFQNQPVEIVNEIAEKLDLDFVQLHGEEDEKYIKKIKIKIIKKVSVDSNITKKNGFHYLLVDRKTQGEGEMVDLEKAKKMSNGFQTFFSGGLTPDNVSTVVKNVKPFAVDVAGGIETNGEHDFKKIKLFIQNAKEESL